MAEPKPSALDGHALARLRGVFETYPEVQAVYLYGSAATGKLRPGSDLDLAIVPRDGCARHRHQDILADLVRIGYCRVDLVFLDGSDLVIQYEAIRQNKIIYRTEDFSRGEFYSRVVRLYLDFLPSLDVQRRAYKRRILSGQT